MIMKNAIENKTNDLLKLPRVGEIVQYELPVVLGIDHIEHLQTVGLAPYDLLLPEREVKSAEPTRDIQLP